jgi:hypothetical protein
LGFWPSLKSLWSGAAIAVGIAGEIIFSMLASSREKRVSVISSQRRTEAEQKTAEALREVASLNVLLERERLQRVKMQERIVRRTITRELNQNERTALAERLKTFAGQNFVFSVVPDDQIFSERMLFERHLDAVLHAAGWINENRINIKQRHWQGVLIFANRGEGGAGVVLAFALSELDIFAQTTSFVDALEPELIIPVGALGSALKVG